MTGSFRTLVEAWCCDACGDTIGGGLCALTDSTGACTCVRCAVDPDADGDGSALAAWRACSGYSPAYLTADRLVSAGPVLRETENHGDISRLAQASSYTLLSR